MRLRSTLCWVTLGLGAWTAAAGASPRQAFERYRNAVVAVNFIVETRLMREVREVSGRELGVVVGPDLVMLNGSLVDVSTTGAQPHSFRVRFEGGSERAATYVGRDEFMNIAFLRLDEPAPPGIRPLRFERSPKLRVGDPVYTIGLLPETLEPMVRLEGGQIIAAVQHPKAFLITDLPTEGTIGGPVFTANGTLAGVLSSMGEDGPSFASGYGGDGDLAYGLLLDAESLVPLVENPPVQGENRRAWLGITLQALDRDKAEYWKLGEATGIIVNSVVPGSPAERGGLREGDIVLAINGQRIPVSEEEHVPLFVEQIGSRPVGSRLDFEFVRDGKRLETNVELSAAPKSRLDAETYRSPEFELTVRELVFQDYRAFDLKPEFRGVLVNRVEEGGWAGVGGLESGDLIQTVDERGIARPSDLKEVLEEAVTQRKRKLVFFVERGGRTQFITVQPNWNGQS